METAEMIKGKTTYNLQVFTNFCTDSSRDRKKCAKSLEIINPIRHFGRKNGIDVLHQAYTSLALRKFIVLITCTLYRTGHDSLPHLCLHWVLCSVLTIAFSHFFAVATRQILIECQYVGKNFLESLLSEHKQNLHSQSKNFNL